MKTIPKHLKKYIIKQDYSIYTSIDQSTWKFIMKISIDFFSKNAHRSYLNGLEKTGITKDKIPRIKSINKKLIKFGWRAVCVRGFIPPNAFMEFQSLKILPIAADMRSHNHLTYTPSPDIVHEAAGHAPIIANRDYSRYLISYGEIASKAIISSEDMQLYYAIRELSDIKENPKSTKKDILKCELNLKKAYNNISYLSESAILSRMNWWTVEYGLAGDIKEPKIYGAGLLSSVAESHNCLKRDVKKLPFSLKCINYNYDITEQQPQLFVTKDFKSLTRSLKNLSKNMSFKLGGEKGLDEAIKAKTTCTIEIDSSIQISGIIDSYINNRNNILYIKTSSPTQLCYKNKEIKGHNKNYHNHGYSTPIGKLKTINKTINELSPIELKKLNIIKNQNVKLQFNDKITVEGKIIQILKKESKIILITFGQCTVKHNKKILFKPSWGNFDMICGKVISSVYGGPCDKEAYYISQNQNDQYLKYNKPLINPLNQELNKLHNRINKLQNKKFSYNKIEDIYLDAKNNFNNEWLIFYEILELSINNPSCYWVKEIINKLHIIIKKNNDLSHAIKRGLDLIKIH
tara:strand:- start:42 stop:1763 length:1722 start_codon:yes stop_codon:yes gene_type:complete